MVGWVPIFPTPEFSGRRFFGHLVGPVVPGRGRNPKTHSFPSAVPGILTGLEPIGSGVLRAGVPIS